MWVLRKGKEGSLNLPFPCYKGLQGLYKNEKHNIGKQVFTNNRIPSGYKSKTKNADMPVLNKIAAAVHKLLVYMKATWKSYVLLG